MPTFSGIDSSIISLPKGAGGLEGVDGNLEVNKQKGTLQFSQPIAVPPGRNNLTPKIALQYSSGFGNSAFGMGWTVPILSIKHDIKYGIPTYQDEESAHFVGSLWDKLIKIETVDNYTRYRPHPDNTFAEIRHVKNGADDFWEVYLPDGSKQTYGKTENSYLYDLDNLDKKCIFEWYLSELQDTVGNKVIYEYFADQDVNQTLLPLSQKREEKNHRYNQVYLLHVSYVDYADSSLGRDLFLMLDLNNADPTEQNKLYLEKDTYNNIHYKILNKNSKINNGTIKLSELDGVSAQDFDQLNNRNIESFKKIEKNILDVTSKRGHTPSRFLYHVVFDYGQYTDWYQSMSSGDTVTDCSLILNKDLTIADYRPDPFSNYKSGFEVRTIRRCKRVMLLVHESTTQNPVLFHSYELNYSQAPFTEVSLLNSIEVIGYQAGQAMEKYPPVEFNYETFNPAGQLFEPMKFSAKPTFSLDDPEATLIDLFGKALPDILHMSNTETYYWRNNGNLEFEAAQLMRESPNISLASGQARFGDIQGNGSADLIVSQLGIHGYFETAFNGTWEKFTPFPAALSWNLTDPQLRLFDTTGDGLIDAVITLDDVLVIYQNHGEGFAPNPVIQPRLHDLQQFPDVNFSDTANRVRLADMTGDGLQDIVIVSIGVLDYWPTKGYGRFGQRIQLFFSPTLPVDVDYNRVYLQDISGSGCADLIYIETNRITIWFNQQGSRLSSPMHIDGTPYLTTSAIQFADLKGQGTQGLVYSFAGDVFSDAKYYFLDITGGKKPYLLKSIENNRGAYTEITYKSSTYFSQQAIKNGNPWQTHLPFPVQCVASVAVVDVFSKGKLTTEYEYHHGYWDGVDREFRGFGCVIQRDTQSFMDYHQPIAKHQFNTVNSEVFSAPIEIRAWFHLGAISRTLKEVPTQVFFDNEFWLDDPQCMDVFNPTQKLLKRKTIRVQRDILNALKGQLFRVEMYALDDSPNRFKPITVTETVFDVYAQARSNGDNSYIGYVFGVRTTEWERGNEPLTKYDFTIKYDKEHNYDSYGRVLKQIKIAVPKGIQDRIEWYQPKQTASPYLVTYSQIIYAVPINNAYFFIAVAKSLRYEVRSIQNIVNLVISIAGEAIGLMQTILSCQKNYYQGNDAFQNLDLGYVSNGLLVKTETLVFTYEQLKAFACSGDSILPTPEVPACLAFDSAGKPLNRSLYAWNEDIPASFRDASGLIKSVGYNVVDENGSRNYYQVSIKKSYNQYGVMIAFRDALDDAVQVNMTYDEYNLLPIKIVKANGLVITANYYYYNQKINIVVDVNDNKTFFCFTPLGLMSYQVSYGKETVHLTSQNADLIYLYRHRNFFDTKQQAEPKPISVTTVARVTDSDNADVQSIENERKNYPQRFLEIVEYQDGFGRKLQTRKRLDKDSEIYFDPTNPTGMGPLLADLSVQPVDSAPKKNSNMDEDQVYVQVSSWVQYNNKGKIIKSYAPFFAQGLPYKEPTSDILSTLSIVTTNYDALDRVVSICQIKEVNGEQTVLSQTTTVYGRVPDFTQPEKFQPTPWCRVVYNPNDNAGRTAPVESKLYQHQWNTPSEVELDPFGRIIKKTEYHRLPGSTALNPIVTQYVYDIRGNQLQSIDANGRVVAQFQYDLLNQVWRTNSMDAGIKRTIYDSVGKVVEIRDQKGAVIFQGYDKFHRPKTLWAKDNVDDKKVRLRQAWDYGDEVSTYTHQEKNTRNLNEVLYRIRDESGELYMTTYDKRGYLLEKKRSIIIGESPIDWSQYKMPDGVFQHTESVQYDALGYPVQRTFTNPYQAFAPEANNRDTVIYVYNYAANVVKSLALNKRTILSKVILNATGQPVLMSYGQSKDAHISIVKQWSYDPHTLCLIRLYSVCNNNNAAGKEIFQNTGYLYDVEKNILSLTEERPGSGVPSDLDHLLREFQYDSLNRLTHATGREVADNPNILPWEKFKRGTGATNAKNFTHDYTYDDVDNLVAQTDQGYGLSSKNRNSFFQPQKQNNQLALVKFASQPEITYSYDSVGNLINENGNRQFTWDYANRLCSFQDGTKKVIYSYDINGVRIKKIVTQADTSTVTIYLNDLLEYRYTERLTVQSEEPQLEEQPLLEQQQYIQARFHFFAGIKRLATISIDSEKNIAEIYYSTDHLANVIRGTNEKGGYVFETEYYPYGEISLGGNEEYPYGVTSKEHDTETGLDYFDARYYAAWLRRWINPDPAGFVDGLNLYSYLKGHLLTFVDVTGLASENPSINDFRRGGNDLSNKVADSRNADREVVLGERSRADSLYLEKLNNEIKDVIHEIKSVYSSDPIRLARVLSSAYKQLRRYEEDAIRLAGETLGQGHMLERLKNNLRLRLTIAPWQENYDNFHANLNHPSVRNQLNKFEENGIEVETVINKEVLPTLKQEASSLEQSLKVVGGTVKVAATALQYVSLVQAIKKHGFFSKPTAREIGNQVLSKAMPILNFISLLPIETDFHSNHTNKIIN